jgi:PIN domain nuclease of toxin-antitoxin system
LTLLDTHALIWLSEGSARLGPRARSLADRALAEGTLAVSAISFWEVAMLRRGGRIELNQPVDAWRAGLLEKGLVEIGIDGELAIAAAELADFHDDPADRLVVATASRLGATLVTADGRIRDWPGELRRHDARA